MNDDPLDLETSAAGGAPAVKITPTYGATHRTRSRLTEWPCDAGGKNSRRSSLPLPRSRPSTEQLY